MCARNSLRNRKEEEEACEMALHDKSPPGAVEDPQPERVVVFDDDVEFVEDQPQTPPQAAQEEYPPVFGERASGSSSSSAAPANPAMPWMFLLLHEVLQQQGLMELKLRRSMMQKEQELKVQRSRGSTELQLSMNLQSER